MTTVPAVIAALVFAGLWLHASGDAAEWRARADERARTIDYLYEKLRARR